MSIKNYNLARYWQSGLSLIELMVTMSIAVILLTIGVPSFVDFINSNTTASYINDLQADLNYARSESITRGFRVTVCHSSDSATCSGASWAAGWIVFVNSNSSNPATTVADAASDILRVHSSLSNGWTMTGNAQGSAYLQFTSTGLPVGATAIGSDANEAIFTLCKGTSVQTGNALSVNQAGRMRQIDAVCS